MTRRGDMKSFFRQQKAHAATKPTGGVSKKTVAAAGAHHHQKAVPALHVNATTTDHGRQQDEAEAEERERAARVFDMDMRYGPCLGLTRAQRLRRAAALGLALPPALLLALCTDDQPCLWEGRV